MAAPRPGAHRQQRRGPHPSRQPRPRLRGRDRQPLRAQPGPRRLPQPRRWRELGERPLRLGQHRCGRPRVRPRRPEHRLRQHVARRAQALDDHLGRAGGRHLHLARRRRHLEPGHRRPPHRPARQVRPGRQLRRPRPRLRAHRGAPRHRRRLPLRRSGRHLASGHRFPADPQPALLLHESGGAPHGSRHPLGDGRGPLDEHRRRPQLAAPLHAPRRQPRPVDQPGQPGHHGPVERRRRQRLDRWRPDLVHPAEPAHRRTLPGGRLGRLPLPPLRRPTGQFHHFRAQPAGTLGARRPTVGLGIPRRLRNRPGGPQTRRPRHRLRQLQGPFRALQSQNGTGAALLRGHGQPVRAQPQGPRIPLSARRPHPRFAPRSEQGLPRLAVRARHHQRRPALGDHLARPHRLHPGNPGRFRTSDHPRRDRRRALLGPVRHPGVGARARRDLGGRQRRSRARDPRRRRQLGRRDAPRDRPVRARADDRSVPSRPREGLCSHSSIPAGRFRSVHLPHRGLRRHLDPHHDRRERRAGQPSRARRARGSRPRGPALPGHRVRDVHLLRRRRLLAALPAQPSGDARHGHESRARGPGVVDDGPGLLDHGQPHAAARTGRPCSQR